MELLFLVAGRGNWEVVRQLWRRLRQPAGVHEERPRFEQAGSTEEQVRVRCHRNRTALNAGAGGEPRSGESRDYLWWLVVCDSVAQARGYRVLGVVGELP